MPMADRAVSKELLRRVPVAWPTLVLTGGALGAWGAANVAAVTGAIPYGLAVVVDTLAVFALFTPMHDATHKAVGEAKLLNEAIGRLASLVFAVPFAAFRHLHLEHHRHTNDPERDPDFYSGAGPRWQLPLRWLTQDLHYYATYFGRLRRRPRREVAEVLAAVALLVALAGGLSLAGWGAEVLLLWLLPARLAIGLLAFAFDYLPHVPHDVRASEDRYRATRILEERWLTPLFLFQNYHLVHHLFPGVPFYRYGLVWRARRGELIAKGARVDRLVSPAPTLASLTRG